MRNKLIKAFTLVELIIVIAIITFISSSSVFYFLDFIKNQEIKQRTQVIINNIKQLDKDIKKYSIFDYKIIFNTTTQSGEYITYTNNFDIPINQTITLNGFTGTISNSGLNTSTGIIEIFKEKKLYKILNNTGGINTIFNFNNDYYYKIKSTLSGEILNEIKLTYFSEDNLKPKKYNGLYLFEINTKKDKSGLSYNNLTIENIGGKKEFYSNGSKITNKEIYLYFEINGKEKFIKLTK